VHDNPSKALSDGTNALPLGEFRPLVKKLLQISKLVRGWNVSAQ
jgi:3-deoxy-D-manno-octulosonic acid (KDO) 8-phosphate synthase